MTLVHARALLSVEEITYPLSYSSWNLKVSIVTNSPIQDYTHPDHHIPHAYAMMVTGRPISANPELNFFPFLFFTFLCIA